MKSEWALLQWRNKGSPVLPDNSNWGSKYLKVKKDHNISILEKLS
jgi:hypothetical protein